MRLHIGAVIAVASSDCNCTNRGYPANEILVVSNRVGQISPTRSEFPLHLSGKKMTTSDPEKRRILFVDDDEESQKFVTLTLPGYRVVTARDFNEGMRLARKRYLDLYILGDQLPNGNGIELCQSIRGFDPNTPVIFLSSMASERDARQALSAGAQMYLIKPCYFDDLQWAVERLISLASERTFEARLAEIAAVRKEVAIRSRDNDRFFEETNVKRLRAEEKKLRAKANKAFIAAGGTRGEFARLWPSVYKREVRIPRHNIRSTATSEA
jgi:DNA-binding response OmpR family regulator